MKKMFFLLLIAAVSLATAQTKYMIYFKDKGISSAAQLHKSSALYQAAEKELSPMAIERRKQVMGEDSYITFEDIPLNESYVGQVEALGIKIAHKLKWFNAVSAYLTDQQIAQIKNLSCVDKIEGVRVYKKRIDETNTVNPAEEQGLKKTNSANSLNYGLSYTQNALSDIPLVHDLGIKGTGVYVGIMDDGFNWKTAAPLMNRWVLQEHNYVTNTSDVSNADTHGTGVFSIMAGYVPGTLIGPAYDANFFLAKTEIDGSETNVEEDNYAAALQDMENAGVQITSSSLGYNIFDQGQHSYTYADMNGNTTIVVKAANLAFDRGVSTFTAAGNEASFWGTGNGGLNSPGDAFNMITVGAVDQNNTMAGFSSRGPTSDGRIKPEVVAMGVNVFHVVSGNSYASGGGTSYATPITAGIGALLKSAWPHLTNVQIRKIFLECGDNTANPNNDRGWGLISAAKAVSYPNLSQSNNVYNVLNKLFIDVNGVNSSSVKLNYRIGTGSLQSVNMTSAVFNNTYKYSYQIPATASGNKIDFYFTYQNTGGALVREPAGTINYNFSYGSNLITGVDEKNSNPEIPAEFGLSQNYPNPFNPSTVISYQLSEPGKVSLKVYDLLGREVAVLADEFKPAGTYTSTFSSLNSTLSSGVYFYVLHANNFTSTKKMMLLK